MAYLVARDSLLQKGQRLMERACRGYIADAIELLEDVVWLSEDNNTKFKLNVIIDQLQELGEKETE